MTNAPDTGRLPNPSQRRDAPGPRGLPFLGSVLEIRRRGQLNFYLENWHAYGDVIRFRLGPYVAHILAHPEHVRYVLAGNESNYDKGPSYEIGQRFVGNGLLTSEGDLWRRQRRLMQPPFTYRFVIQLDSQMATAIEAMLERWQAGGRDGTALAIYHEMASLALTIVGNTLFSVELGASIQPIMEGTIELISFVNRRLATFVGVPLVIPTPANRRFKERMRRFDAVVYQLIEARRQTDQDTHDLLGRLLAARDNETDSAMSDQQIRDEVLTILLAGYETTALALGWTWYLLAHHPEVEQRLHAELAATLGGRTPTVDDLENLSYTQMVIQEVLRLYPPAWTFPRGAITDDEIGGYHIPAGSIILVSPYLTHRHPDFWENPERFDPERFAAEQSASRARQAAYFPFGLGPRSCIGRHYAMVVLPLVVATVAQRYRLRLLPGPPIEPKSVVTLHPTRDVLMTLEAR